METDAKSLHAFHQDRSWAAVSTDPLVHTLQLRFCVVRVGSGFSVPVLEGEGEK